MDARAAHCNGCSAPQGAASAALCCLTLSGGPGRLAPMLRLSIVLLACLYFTACSDPSSDTADGNSSTTGPVEKVLGFGEPCTVDEPFSPYPSVDACKDGLICALHDFNCNKGICAVACAHPPFADNDPCQPIDGVETACRYTYTNGPQACVLPCDDSTICPDIFSHPLACIASSCRVPDTECGVESGET